MKTKNILTQSPESPVVFSSLCAYRDMTKTMVAHLTEKGRALTHNPLRTTQDIVELNVNLARARAELESVQYQINKHLTGGA